MVAQVEASGMTTYEVPSGEALELPGRGVTYVTDSGGAPGLPTALLLHGAFCTGRLTWHSVIPALSEHFRVITLDQRGHGAGIRSRSFTLRDLADDAAALIDVLGLDRPLVVGHSMGSLVAQRLWRQHRGLVSGLVLCSSTDRFRHAPRQTAFFSAMSAVAGTGGWWPLLPQLSPPAARVRGVGAVADEAWMRQEMRRNTARGLVQGMAACGRHHSAPWLSEVDVPTAVVVTLQDEVVPAERQRRVAELIDGATLHEVDADHNACMTARERFAPAVVTAAVEVAGRAGLL